MLKRTNYLPKVYGMPEGWTLAAYERELQGYQTAKKVLTTMSTADVVAEAKKANIRGRGGPSGSRRARARRSRGSSRSACRRSWRGNRRG